MTTDFIRLLKNPRFYIENFIKIRNKKGKLIPLKLKPAQIKLYDIMKREHEAGKPVRIVILKARQLGFSTVIEALFFQDAATRELVKTLIVAHSADATANLFKMNKLFYDKLPSALKPMRRASNAQEIVFENPTRDTEEKALHPGLMSSIRCVPATGEGVGRSDTLTNVHASEAAFWSNMNDTLDALLQAVPDSPDTAVVIETTPNGFNSFKLFWDDTVAGKTGFVPVFFPWFEDPDYRKPVPPGTEWTDEELELKEAYKLDDEQLAWRRWCIASNLRGDAEKFKQEYPSCPEEAFLLSGNPYFELRPIILRIERTKEILRRGRFIYSEGENLRPENIAWQEADDGEICIWQDVEKGVPFVAGGDTAGDGSDRFTAVVIDNVTSEQVVELVYSGGSEIWYAQQLYCLGKYFNNALIGVEINYSTYPERKLEEWGYPKLYIREKTDDVTRELNVKKFGWRTDPRTRPLILANLHAVVLQTPEVINSEALLNEMLTFIRNEDMRPEAAPGAHDDLVIAAAIAHFIRPQQSFTIHDEIQKAPQKLINQLEKHKRR
ncbi:MAG: hypothetical protein IJP16_04975 [Clostridia bacterium]|nr:hypothetical protein [Clostridia bacterium]